MKSKWSSFCRRWVSDSTSRNKQLKPCCWARQTTKAGYWRRSAWNKNLVWTMTATSETFLRECRNFKTSWLPSWIKVLLWQRLSSAKSQLRGLLQLLRKTSSSWTLTYNKGQWKSCSSIMANHSILSRRSWIPSCSNRQQMRTYLCPTFHPQKSLLISWVRLTRSSISITWEDCSSTKSSWARMANHWDRRS